MSKTKTKAGTHWYMTVQELREALKKAPGSAQVLLRQNDYKGKSGHCVDHTVDSGAIGHVANPKSFFVIDFAE